MLGRVTPNAIKPGNEANCEVHVCTLIDSRVLLSVAYIGTQNVFNQISTNANNNTACVFTKAEAVML